MNELDKNYSPNEIEEKWYKTWEESKFFAASLSSEKENYSIVIPPPNVTGILHMGHVLNNSIQDTLIRYNRMRGKNTLWMPGCDHAGIATQNKVERKLAEEGLKKEDIGREKFLEMTWDWKEKYGGIITQQLRKLGASLDWDRERFTMDEGLSYAVRKIFNDLYHDGLIYQGEYMVNWCPSCGTALADDEVDHEEKDGHLWQIKYPVKDSDEYIIIATSRPETMLADVAVAVHPEDERYKHLIGKTLILPLVNREIPVIADEYVDKEFGTGALKITPAHDPNDYNLGKKYNLPVINMLTPDGKIVNDYPKYAGLDRFEARKKIVEDLKAQDFFIKTEHLHHAVGQCYRCQTVIEPRVSPQWFVKMKPLAEKALEVVRNGEIKILPKRMEKIYYNWLENIRDWCISRQIWWGHRIPAWYGPDRHVFVAMDEAEAKEQAKKHYGHDVELSQEEDVLDTWFSSALWPFSTMGWPDVEAEDFKRYFPTSTLVTGYDIIFFWVSRMIFQSLEFTGRQPFKNVLIHGLIRDEQGRKMSKSLGNGIDPMDVIEKYGADALRWFLSNGSAPGQDVRFSYEKMDASWNFINKIWNISRYILMNNEGLTLDAARENVAKVAAGQAGNVTDRWILHNLNETIEKVTENFDKFEFGVAGHILYNFIWDEFADWYVELTKEVLYSDNEDEKVITRSVLLYTLDQILRLLHPIMPFVTEEIFGQISEGTIVTAEYPVVRPEFENEEAAAGVEALKDVIRSVRNSRAEVNVAPSKPITILIKTSDSKLDAFFNDNVNYIKRFTNPEHLEIAADVEVPDLVMSSIITGAEIYLPLADLLNVEEELARLEKELAKWQKELDMVGKKLSNERFVANAKSEVVQKERDKQADYQAKYDATVARIDEMKKLVK